MRIAIVTHNLAAGGSERVISLLVTKWHSLGVECHLVFTDNDTVFYEIPPQIPIYVVAEKEHSRAVRKIKTYTTVRKIVKEIQPDIVLSLPEEIGIYVAIAMLGLRIPLVVSERNDPRVMPYKKATRILRKISYHFVSGFIFQTEQALNFFPEYIKEKSIILDNPLDLTGIPEPFTYERKKLVVGVGRLEKQKNFDLLIDAFAQFHKIHSDYRLLIYGEGTMREQLEKHIKALQLCEDTILLPGRVVNPFLQVNDAMMFVLSSDYEGMPNALIEAMAFGIPCISTDCPSGGVAAIIDNGENGILVSVGNADELAAAMGVIADYKALQKQLSENGRFVRNRFDAETVCLQWLVFLKSKCENGRTKPEYL